MLSSFQVFIAFWLSFVLYIIGFLLCALPILVSFILLLLLVPSLFDFTTLLSFFLPPISPLSSSSLVLQHTLYLLLTVRVTRPSHSESPAPGCFRTSHAATTAVVVPEHRWRLVSRDKDVLSLVPTDKNGSGGGDGHTRT